MMESGRGDKARVGRRRPQRPASTAIAASNASDDSFDLDLGVYESEHEAAYAYRLAWQFLHPGMTVPIRGFVSEKEVEERIPLEKRKRVMENVLLRVYGIGLPDEKGYPVNVKIHSRPSYPTIDLGYFPNLQEAIYVSIHTRNMVLTQNWRPPVS